MDKVSMPLSWLFQALQQQGGCFYS
ncbi:hypothetical protein FF1_014120 [Malus domestica]